MMHGMENGEAGGGSVVVPILGWKQAGEKIKDEVEKEGEDPNGEYVKLKDGELEEGYGGIADMGLGVGPASPFSSSSPSCSSSCCSSRCWWSIWWWAKLILVVGFLAVLAAVFFKWIGPFFMDKVKKNPILYFF